MNPYDKLRTIPSYYIILLSLIPSLFFVFVLKLFLVNNPFQDDLDALIAPTAKIVSQPFNWDIFIDTIFGQDDERRHIVSRLLCFSMFSLTGKLDLRIIIAFGLTSYIVFLYLIYKVWFGPNNNISNYWFLPLVWIIFTPINYGALLQAVVPIQHISVYIWCFVSLWFIAKVNGKYFWAGIFFAILAICCDVSGNLIFPIGLLSLLFQKRYKEAIYWTVILGIITFLYAHNLQVPTFRPTLKDNIKHWHQMILIILCMPGMFIDIFPFMPDIFKIIISCIVGIITLIFLCYQFYKFLYDNWIRKKAFEEKMLWLWSCFALLFATFVIFAIGRASESATSILLNRYKHMFIYWLILLYLLFTTLPIFKKSLNSWRYIIITFVLSLLFFVNNYWQAWGEMDFYRKNILTDAYGWYHNRAIPSSPIYLSTFVKDTVDKMYINALKVGVYKIPNTDFEGLVRLIPKDSIKVNLEDGEYTVAVHIESLERGLHPTDGMYVLLKSEHNTHILPTKTYHNNIVQLLSNKKYYNSFSSSINFAKEFLTPQTTYKVLIGVVNGNKKYVLSTNNFVRRLH